MKKERKEKLYRIIAFYLVINLLGEVFYPTCALALTGGPSQPEFESFEPAGTNEMVDLFSGDFSYNIPLLNIPGPNGGYPVNLAYHAGITMEQEASWVGLGWNINPGVINRSVRGLPDDFNGDKVTKEFYRKEKIGVDFSVGLGTGTEFLGFPIEDPDGSFGVTYDSDDGYGLSYDGSLGVVEANYSTQDGLGLNYAVKIPGPLDLSYGGELNSREGITSWGWKSIGSGREHVATTQIPSNTMPLHTDLNMFDFKGLDYDFGVFEYYQATGSYSKTKVPNTSVDFDGFGYCYLQNNPKHQTAGYLLDFNRESDHPISKEVEALPVPMITEDLYHVSAEGLQGNFKGRRSDIGILSDPQIVNTTQGHEIQAELGIGDLTHLGTAINNAIIQDETSGRWSDKYSSINDAASTAVDFSSGDEVFAFKFSDELNTDEGAISSASNASTGAQAIDIQLAWADKDHEFVPEITNHLNKQTGFPGGVQYRQGRRKRDRLVEYRTRDEITQNSAKGIGNHVLPTYPSSAYTSYSSYQSALQKYSYSGRKGHHHGEISVVKPDGFRYQYGIPVYQNTQKDVVFSVDAPVTSPDQYGHEVKYDYSITPGPGTCGGDDELYQSASLPEHASNYLLTGVYSPDYVDLTGDGPTGDDMGYYVKYTYYKKNSSFKWRFPFVGGFRNKGDFSNMDDDKVSYMYGEKETWYLYSIETKTHIAVFNLADRNDGVETNGDKNPTGAGSNRLSYLDHIDLFDIKDMAQPLETVHFEYDYSLCPGVPNNSHISGSPSGTGKLTLLKVWFSYLGSSKGQLSPYKFEYTEGNQTTYGDYQNPSYSTEKTDRWGNYKDPWCKRGYTGSSSSGWNYYPCANDDNTYTEQNLDYDHDNAFDTNSDGKYNELDEDFKKRNYHASAWCLRKITLPSGGIISVDYEQDEYAYVQDQEATEMFQVIATGNTSTGQVTTSGDITGPNTRLYFPLKLDLTQTSSPQYYAPGNSIAKYLPAPHTDGKRYIYFKTLTEIKNTLDFASMARDYVDGYFEIVNYGIDNASVVGVSGGGKVGWVDVSSVEISNVTGGLCHPIRKAAWQHLKLKRPDLLYPQTNSLSLGIGLLQVLLTIFKDAETELVGYYNACFLNGYAKELDLTYTYSQVINGNTYTYAKPSFIRLKDPTGRKKGGGHRVRRITYNDSWYDMSPENAPSDTYGQEYSYLLKDGRSSGVASYEPLLGGEENPLKIPSRVYSPINGDVPFKDKNLYLEKPYGEKYYPTPVVGYSNVIVKNIDRLDVNGNIANQKSLSGVSVSEFYTAKDFPISVDYTDVNPVSFEPPDTEIPLVGTIKYDNHGYSQGYEIKLNNMHGQLKSQATYAPICFTQTANGYVMAGYASPQAKVEYVYKTNGAFSPNHKNELNNSVTVLDANGAHRTALLGQTGEEFVDLRENTKKKDFSYTNLNVDIIFPFAPPVLPFFLMVLPWPTVNYEESMFRSVVHNKVIYQTGIISEVRTTKDGSTIVMKNLMYDSNTGEPLLTSVTNNFNKPVYTFDYQAYWSYNSMGPAYQNYRYQVNFSTPVSISAGTFTIPTGYANNFHLGDIVQDNNGTQYWVTNISGTTITLTDRYGNLAGSSSPITVSYLFIVKSGFTNEQDAKMGHIVSLKNVVTSSSGIGAGFLAALNQYLQNNTINSSGSVGITYQKCGGGTDIGYVTFTVSGGNIIAIDFATIGPPGCDGRMTLTLADGGNPPVSFINHCLVTPLGPTTFQLTNTITGQIATGTGGALNCLQECSSIDSVLHVSAVHYTDGWGFNYNDIGAPVVDNSSGTTSALTTAMANSNPYRFGSAGIWRPLNSWTYIIQRSQASGTVSSPQDFPQTQIDKDGTFSFERHKWYSDRLFKPGISSFTGSPSVTTNPKWTFVSEITRYNPFGFVNEKVDALGVYSSTLYGYTNSIKTAETANSSYFETAFESFEDQNVTSSSATYVNPTGHIIFSSNPTLALVAHTGKASLSFANSGNASIVVAAAKSDAYTGTDTRQGFTPLDNGHYLLSFWIKKNTNNYTVDVPTVTGGTSGVINLGPVIDGWQKVDYDFMVSAGAASFNLQIAYSAGLGGYIDDIRIQPYKSAMKSYVYDLKRLWLVGELDNRNFATFYNYDEEGELVQVKKETEKGIVTIKTNRNNIRRNP